MEDIAGAFSFSTMWNYMRSQNGAELMRQIMELGFRKVELNYRISRETLDSIIPLLERGVIEVNSIHNVFPRTDDPAFDTDSPFLGNRDPQLRRQAVELTQRSLDYAHRLGAGAVVIHPGAAPETAASPYDSRLKEMYRQGRKDSPEYQQLYREMIDFRAAESPRCVQWIKESLAEICDYIGQKNYQVSLGLENRAMCHQIPDFQEACYLLDELKGYPVYFWYDIGHGLALETLGMFNSLTEAWKLKSKIIGVHIHDTVGVDDHWTPYLYGDQLDAFLTIIRDAPIRVLELGSKNKAAEIREGVAILGRKLGQLSISGGRR